MRKIMKSVISCICVAALLCTSFLCWNGGFNSKVEAAENVSWKISEDGTVEILGTGDIGTSELSDLLEYKEQIKHIVIGKEITSISYGTFSGCSNLQEVEFEEGSKIEVINRIFPVEYEQNLTNLNFLAGLKNLELLFLNTKELEDISALAQLESLESIYFKDTKLTDMSVLLELSNLTSISMNSCCIEQELFEACTGYNLILSLGEEVPYSPGYYADSVKGKCPVVVSGSWAEDFTADFLKDGVVYKAGTANSYLETSIRIKDKETGEDIGYAKVPVTVECIDWNTEPELENEEKVVAKLDTSNVHAVILDANNTLWEITDKKTFNTKKVESNVKEYVAEYIYIKRKEEYFPTKVITDLLYVDKNNTLYCGDEIVSEKVKKYDKMYALDEEGTLKDMKGQTIFTGVKDFCGAYYYESRVNCVYSYMVLKEDGELILFDVGAEDTPIVVDINVTQLEQGCMDYGQKAVFAEYLKDNGEMYGCFYDKGNGFYYEKISDDVAMLLEFSVMKMKDNTVWASDYKYEKEKSGYYTYTVVRVEKKKLFDNADDILKIYDINSKGTDYYIENQHFGMLKEILFADKENCIWGFDSNGTKSKVTEKFSSFVPGGFMDTEGNAYKYHAEGTVVMAGKTITYPDEIVLKDNILYKNGVAIMNQVADFDLVDYYGIALQRGNIVFLRFDGTIWMLDENLNTENEVPKKVATFGQAVAGDMNGDDKINMQDCALLRRYLAGWNVTIDESAADVDGNGKLTLLDSALLRRYLAGWNVELK